MAAEFAAGTIPDTAFSAEIAAARAAVAAATAKAATAISCYQILPSISWYLFLLNY